MLDRVIECSVCEKCSLSCTLDLTVKRKKNKSRLLNGVSPKISNHLVQSLVIPPSSYDLTVIVEHFEPCMWAVKWCEVGYAWLKSYMPVL